MAPHLVILSSMPISGEPAKHVTLEVKFPAKEKVKFPVELPANI